MSERITLQGRRTVQADGTIMTHRKMIDVATVREHAMDIYFELKKFEDILYDESGKEIISLDRLREIAEAEREGRLILLPFALGSTIHTINRDENGRFCTNEHEVGAYLVATGCGYSEDIYLSAAGEMTADGFREYETFGMGTSCGDWRGQYRAKPDAENVAALAEKGEKKERIERATTDGWIPCSERLPTEDDVYGRVEFEITVQSGEERYVTTGFYTEEQLWEDAKGNVIFVPIAYRSLPEPYKGEE